MNIVYIAQTSVIKVLYTKSNLGAIKSCFFTEAEVYEGNPLLITGLRTRLVIVCGLQCADAMCAVTEHFAILTPALVHNFI